MAATSGWSTKRVDDFLVAVDHVEDSVGKPGLVPQLGEPVGGRGNALRGLHDERVAASDGDRRHPERDHRREVERPHARAHAERLPERKAVDAATHLLGVLALEELGNAAGKLDDFHAARDRAVRVIEHFAVLGGEQRGELVMCSSMSALNRKRTRARRTAGVADHPT